jgi:hypothetical protein
VLAFGALEAQRLGDRIKRTERNIINAALLESTVPCQADLRNLGDFATAQTANVPATAGGQTNFRRLQTRTSLTQKMAESAPTCDLFRFDHG